MSEELKLRKLKKEGIKKFEEFILSLKDNEKKTIPLEYLNNEYSEEITNANIVLKRDYDLGTRKQAAIFFQEKLINLDESLQFDQGIWSWISLFYFEQLCSNYVDKYSKEKKTGGVYGYIPSDDYRYYYRHKLLGPYQLLLQHGKYASALLSNQVNVVGDFNEQVAARQQYVQNKEIMKVIHKLYYNSNTDSFKRGATSTDKDKPGTLRRFISFENRISLTYDLQSMDSEAILDLLPPEFDEYLK